MQTVESPEIPYEFKRYEDGDKPKIFALEDIKNPMHLKMFLTDEEYLKTPEFRQKYYNVCS